MDVTNSTAVVGDDSIELPSKEENFYHLDICP